jgi:L-ribulose-5-phosphate 3-epimerase UlaE
VEVFSVMNSKHWSCPLSDADDTVRAESREGMLDSIATATTVGADMDRIIAGTV